MESIRIYEDSHEELIKIRRSLATDTITINSSKLDEQTKRELINAISNVIDKRTKETETVILGVQ